ncbi:MAG TPA: DUF5686 family protein, partial [Bacteroidales bacterium]|nr:DUF5686 family protein [Bacteroidales bacterium]
MWYKGAIVLIIAFTNINIYAQEISGKVCDEETREPVPFANVWFKGTTTGTMTDINGNFKLSSLKGDTLSFSSVGYFPKEIRMGKNQKKNLNIFLERNIIMLNEVKVTPEVPRAKVLFKEILKHKKENRENIQKFNDYKTFARTAVYAAVDTSAKSKGVFNNWDEVTMKIDDQELRFVPIYHAELGTASKEGEDSIVYSKKDGIFPKLNQTIESLILLNVVIELDFYQDQIDILGRGFTSPISNSARLYYDIYLNDSTVVDSVKFYHFSFTPKNKYNPLFTGRFTVEDGSFALTNVYAYIQKEANINFVNGFEADVSYRKTEEGNWFHNNQEINFNLSITLNKDTLSKYGSERIDEISAGNWLVNKTTLYSTAKRLNHVKADEWKNQPEFSSNQLKANTYAHIDKLKENQIVKGIDAIGGMVLTSYIDMGKTDVGPVFDIYSTNAIEGQRFTLPLRTGEKLFKNFYVGGFLGYGTKN